MILLLALAFPARAVDPDTAFYVTSSAAGSAALSAIDTADTTTLAAQADPADVGGDTAALAMDPIAGVLYARAGDGTEIHAFDPTDLSRLPAWDIAAEGAGGALEIDPFRRLLYAVEDLGGDSTIRVYSIDLGATYGQVVADLPASGIWSGATGNHLARDWHTDAFYAAQGDPADEVWYFDVSGQGFDAFTWPAGTALGIGRSDITAVAVCCHNATLAVSTTSSLTTYLVHGPGLVIEHPGTLPTDPIGGLHWVWDASWSGDLAYTDLLAETVRLSTAGTSVSLPSPGAVEQYPLVVDEGDDDGDGLWDSVELGATGIGAYSDTDPGTTTDPDDPDSDADGVEDGVEDGDGDGAFDVGELDPLDPDTDDDGVLDGADVCPLVADPAQADLDGDGAGDLCDPDVDGDGSPAGTDCDDADPATWPGAPEIWYDGIDEGCDGGDDYDQDGDGFQPTAFGGFDCDDTRDRVHPGATDHWYDGIDADCAGDSDFDMDRDGFDSASYGGTDCDDANPDTWPGAPDDPYDGVVNDCSATDEYDADGDGYRSVDFGGSDCDDASSAVNPGADEVWYDAVDQDCDGNDDDQDGDGWPLATDCDDTDPTAWPGAPGWSEDCDPIVDTGDSGPPVDTSPPVDTGDSAPPVDTSPPEDSTPADDTGTWSRFVGGGGCRCASPTGPAPLAALGWILGLVGLGWVRRRP